MGWILQGRRSQLDTVKLTDCIHPKRGSILFWESAIASILENSRLQQIKGKLLPFATHYHLSILIESFSVCKYINILKGFPYKDSLAQVHIYTPNQKMHPNSRQMVQRSHPQRNNMSLDVARRGPMDMMRQFDNMHNQIMKSFMGFGFGDDMFGPQMGMGRNPMEDMFKFSEMHQHLHDKKSDGAYVFQSYVSSSHMGADGKMHTENYFQNNVGQHRGGQTISQKQQAYKNSQGINRIAQERMLNSMGRKIVKEKRGNNDIQQTNHYFNLDQNQVADFDNRWQQANHETKFHDQYGKYIMGNPNYNPNALSFGPGGQRSIGSQQRHQPSSQLALEQGNRVGTPSSRIRQQQQPQATLGASHGPNSFNGTVGSTRGSTGSQFAQRRF